MRCPTSLPREPLIRPAGTFSPVGTEDSISGPVQLPNPCSVLNPCGCRSCVASGSVPAEQKLEPRITTSGMCEGEVLACVAGLSKEA